MSGDDNFLSRWSRLKREARRAPSETPPSETPPSAPPSAPATEAPQAIAPAPEKAPLPPIETLTPESDFTAFMQPEVDPSLRRQALKTLFKDPRYNVMDGLDVYIDDYSKPDPLPEGWLEKMNVMASFRAQEPERTAEQEVSIEAPQEAPIEATQEATPPAEPSDCTSPDVPIPAGGTVQRL